VIFSILLTLILSGLIVYALLQKRDFPVVGRALPLVAAVGIYVAWFPDRTSSLAHWVGIGRGVDLMLYVWLLASGLLFLVLHLKFVTQQRQLTELARYVAITNAQVPAVTSASAAPEPVAPASL
jgi:hypothetical protein